MMTKGFTLGGQTTEAMLHDRLSLSSAMFFTKDISRFLMLYYRKGGYKANQETTEEQSKDFRGPKWSSVPSRERGLVNSPRLTWCT